MQGIQKFQSTAANQINQSAIGIAVQPLQNECTDGNADRYVGPEALVAAVQLGKLALVNIWVEVHRCIPTIQALDLATAAFACPPA